MCHQGAGVASNLNGLFTALGLPRRLMVAKHIQIVLPNKDGIFPTETVRHKGQPFL
jgi:hypothetical protein